MLIIFDSCKGGQRDSKRPSLLHTNGEGGGDFPFTVTLSLLTDAAGPEAAAPTTLRGTQTV